MHRKKIAEIIFHKLNKNKKNIEKSYSNSLKRIGYFYLDNLLPEKFVQSIFQSFPNQSLMMKRKNLREYKHVSSQMNQFNEKLEELTFSFQNEKIVSWIQNLIKTNSLYPDKYLYAGGISSMGKGQFLNPHLDNSHDIKRKNWRVINLLYYITPNWNIEYGGNLELWDKGLSHEPITIHSKFNRLVVMETHSNSWHSVNPVIVKKNRCCISNYYFSNNPLRQNDSFHITSFRGRPHQKIRDLLLKGDSKIRMVLRKFFSRGLIKTKHVYKK